MKIMILTPFPPDGIGGAETFVKDLISAAKKTHDIYLCTMGKRRSPWRGTGLFNLFSTFPYLFIKAFILNVSVRPQIIHAQGLISGAIAVLLKKIFNNKVLVTLLALYEFDKKPTIFHAVSRWIFLKSDCVFVEGLKGSQDMYSAFIPILKHMGDMTKYKVNVKQFNHWVNQDIFNPDPNRIKDGIIRILFVGRPIKEKGHHVIEKRNIY